jgi:hypothetical protein
MLKRTLMATMLGGALLFATPHAAFADGRHGGRDRDDRHSEHHWDRGHDRDDYYRHHGYDDDYYGYYGYGCNGYRDGWYYGPDGRRDGYYHRNADCDDYYRHYGSYYGSPYCSAYDYRTGYCG